jgi:cytosine/adenosine deaminase-related metal-dependent hydrolase
LRSAGAAVVWCPTSNRFLFGRTAPAELLAPGIDVLLGSDSLLSGEGSLLRELYVARRLGLLSRDRLCDAVAETAARRLGVERPSLEIGARADVVVLRRPLLDASDSDVAVVVAGGALRVVDPVLLPALGTHADAGRIIAAGGVPRWISDQPSPIVPEPERKDRPSRNNRIAR